MNQYNLSSVPWHHAQCRSQQSPYWHIGCIPSVLMTSLLVTIQICPEIKGIIWEITTNDFTRSTNKREIGKIGSKYSKIQNSRYVWITQGHFWQIWKCIFLTINRHQYIKICDYIVLNSNLTHKIFRNLYTLYKEENKLYQCFTISKICNLF